ncbi:MAG: hypothetical protein ACLQU1_23040 [Bryobacteraceae bacterium]
MKRRTFLAGSGLAGPAMAFLADAEAPAEAPATRWEKSAQRKREITQGIVWPNHEDLAFLLRRGGNPEDVVEHYEAQHDPANIPRMAAAGIRYARIHFYKGLGLQAEGPEIERSRRTVALMKVGTRGRSETGRVAPPGSTHRGPRTKATSGAGCVVGAGTQIRCGPPLPCRPRGHSTT